ncbi:MAG: hypothetical protein AB7N76_12440 [Planctomycetota bacterium]
MATKRTKSARPRATAAVRELGDALAELPHVPEQVLDTAQLLRQLAQRFRSLGRGLAWHVAYGETDAIHMRAFSLLSAAAKGQGLQQRVSQKLCRQAAELTAAALADPWLGDQRKLMVMRAHELVGGERLSTAELGACFSDFPGAVQEAGRRHAAALGDSVECVDGLLETWMEVEPGADPLERVLNGADLIASNGRASATLLVVAAALACEQAHGAGSPSAPDSRLAALDRAAALDPARALPLLSELGTWPNAGPLGLKARELGLRLRSRELRAEPLPAPAFLRGCLSPLDGAGSQLALLLFQREEHGPIDGLSLLLNDRAGLKEVWCAHGSGPDVEHGALERGLALAPCDQALARELVADALLVHERSGRPLPGRFLLFRTWLGHEPLEPAPRALDLRAYELERIPRQTPQLWEGSVALADTELYGGFRFQSEAAWQFVREQVAAGGLRLHLDLVLDFLDEVEPHERELLAARLAVNLDHAARAAKAHEPIQRRAARTWVALAEGRCILRELPYAVALGKVSIEAIAANLARGFESQEEANQAALAGGPFATAGLAGATAR